MPTKPTAYVPALDGLRALAVALVVALHSGIGLVPGGQVGVDIFLVLSGYLITSLLLAEYRATGHVRFIDFYIRRSLRLYPALLAMLAAVVVTALLTNSRPEFEPNQEFLTAIAIAGVYLTDIQAGWQLWVAADSSPVFHTWSLSIEEHFYLIWPPVLWLLLRSVGERGARIAASALAALIVAWTGVLAALSVHNQRLEYSIDTRGLGLVVGCVLALVITTVPKNAVARWSPIAAWGGLAVVAASAMLALPVRLQAWGGYLFVDMASVLMLLGAISTGTFQRLFTLKALVTVGKRSYGIYLWHFPIFHLIAHARFPGLNTLVLALLKLLLLVVTVELSYRLIETPFLRLRHRFTPRGASSMAESTIETRTAVGRSRVQ